MEKENIFSGFPKNRVAEFVLIPIGIFSILFIKLYNISAVSGDSGKKAELVLIGLVIGALHLFASNALTFCYNLQHYIFPFVPKIATPKRLKVAGFILIGISIIGFFSA